MARHFIRVTCIPEGQCDRGGRWRFFESNLLETNRGGPSVSQLEMQNTGALGRKERQPQSGNGKDDNKMLEEC